MVASGGININEELVRSGAAWVYDRYCTTGACEEWQRLENAARKGGQRALATEAGNTAVGMATEKINPASGSTFSREAINPSMGARL